VRKISWVPCQVRDDGGGMVRAKTRRREEGTR
jgi:hypothetical protein